MPSVMCEVLKDIQIGAIEKEIVPDGKGMRYQIGKDAKVVPYGTIKKGLKVQLRHGWNGTGEQRVYIASHFGSGWFMTDNKNGYSLNEVFKASRKNRTPWEALY